jgi:hypothetical protein
MECFQQGCEYTMVDVVTLFSIAMNGKVFNKTKYEAKKQHYNGSRS